VTTMPRTLFVFRDLPRPVVSMQRTLAGEEALSGTNSSGLLVAEGLARRGHEIAVVTLDGRELTEARFARMNSLEDAARWVGGGRVVWVYYGNDEILEQLNAAGLKPVVWSHIHVSRLNRDWLEAGQIHSVLTVSDTARVSLLRSATHSRTGRVYNPLAPVFDHSEGSHPSADRFTSKRVVFCGHPSISKGAHRLLAMWSHVKEAEPAAVLHLAGTRKLYGDAQVTGALGVFHPEFEKRYVQPLVAKFGSLDAAGIQPSGLLSPRDLCTLYEGAQLGVVNPNWFEYTETFCCAAVEMLATGLPVFGVARGALPETIGPSGGVFLSCEQNPKDQARDFLAFLRRGTALEALGLKGASYVRREYGWSVIVERWEEILRAAQNIERATGRWRGPVDLRYWIERSAGRLGAGRLLDLRQPRRAVSRAIDF
jgi:hypothetical protein